MKCNKKMVIESNGLVPMKIKKRSKYIVVIIKKAIYI